MDKSTSIAHRERPLWEPSAASLARTNLTSYLEWLEKFRNLSFRNYSELWTWSTDDPNAFWSSLAEYFDVRFHHPSFCTLSSREMPGARWFPEATLNYAEHALRPRGDDEKAAIIFEAEEENGQIRQETFSRSELRRQVALIADSLRGMGVTRGDCVAGFLANTPETVIAFLATASLGAIWSNCPVEMTGQSVLDRFTQIAPKVLFASCNYRYGGKRHDRSETVEEIVAGLPGLRHLVVVPGVDDPRQRAKPPCLRHRWEDLLARPEVPELFFDRVPFEHPLWILYSSGTTGKPKAIVHGHGGILLEHMKALSLHLDLQKGDRFFWYTTSGWMMWNFLVSGLLLSEVAIVLYDGSPKYPGFQVLWNLVERLGVTYFGASAALFMACRKEGLCPRELSSLERLRGVGSTGAPLPAEGFTWIYEKVKSDLVLGSVSGGTDVCSAFVLSNPHLPVYAGKIQCLGLGAKIEAWNEQGRAVLGEVGELVLTAPFPSMPIFLWNDPDGSRLRSSYFEKFPGVWSHGDWIEIQSAAGPCVIHGRSDATLNRGGVRMGTVEFYSILEALPEIREALVIDTGGLGREDRLLLFVALRPGSKLDDSLRRSIVQTLRSEVSPRHVPDAIYEIPEVPRTLNGKKLEVPIKRILTGTQPEEAVQFGTVGNPESLEIFVQLAATLSPGISSSKKS